MSCGNTLRLCAAFFCSFARERVGVPAGTVVGHGPLYCFMSTLPKAKQYMHFASGSTTTHPFRLGVHHRHSTSQTHCSTPAIIFATQTGRRQAVLQAPHSHPTPRLPTATPQTRSGRQQQQQQTAASSVEQTMAQTTTTTTMTRLNLCCRNAHPPPKLKASPPPHSRTTTLVVSPQRACPPCGVGFVRPTGVAVVMPHQRSESESELESGPNRCHHWPCWWRWWRCQVAGAAVACVTLTVTLIAVTLTGTLVVIVT